MFLGCLSLLIQVCFTAATTSLSLSLCLSIGHASCLLLSSFQQYLQHLQCVTAITTTNTTTIAIQSVSRTHLVSDQSALVQ